MLLRKRFFDSHCHDDLSSASSSKCEPEYEHDKDQTRPHSTSHVETRHPTIMAPSTTNGRLRSGSGHATKSESASIDSHANGQTSIQERNATRTDYSRWRLLDERGRQTWQYLEDDEDVAEWPQSTVDKYFLGLPIVCMPIWLH